MAALLRASSRSLLTPAEGLSADVSLRAVAYSRPSLRLSGWRKDGRHVPPYSTWKAKKEAEQEAAAAKRPPTRPQPAAAPPRPTVQPRRTRNVRIPPLGPMIDPRWLTAFSFCKDLPVTYHLADDCSAALPLDLLRTLVIDPLVRDLAGIQGTLAAGASTVRSPLSVAFTFARVAGTPVDLADDTVFAVVHAADLVAHLAKGKTVESLCGCLDGLRSQPGSGDRTILFVLDLAQVATASPQDPALEASIRQALRSAELSSGSQTFVNHLDSAGTPSPSITLLSFIVALAEGPHRRHKDEAEYIGPLQRGRNASSWAGCTCDLRRTWSDNACAADASRHPP